MCFDLAFHDGLDYISVHQKLLDEFKESLKSARPKQSLESKVEAIAKANTSSDDRPALRAVSILCSMDRLAHLTNPNIVLQKMCQRLTTRPRSFC